MRKDITIVVPKDDANLQAEAAKLIDLLEKAGHRARVFEAEKIIIPFYNCDFLISIGTRDVRWFPYSHEKWFIESLVDWKKEWNEKLGISVPLVEPVAVDPAEVKFKVTAICPTHNRRKYLPSSMAMFMAQTFTDSELLIVDDGTESAEDLIPKHPRIRYMRLAGPRLTSGEKRNVCCTNAHGEIIVHWDDDDWQHPERIADQVNLLEKSGKQVLTYYNLLVWNESRNIAGRMWPNNQGNCHGASLCYKKSWWLEHRFANQMTGEDTLFGMVARASQQLFAVDAQDMIVYRVHAANTSNPAGFGFSQGIPLVDKSQIPADFFLPLLPVYKTSKDDLILAVIVRYGWNELRTFANSLVRTGFDGTKLLCVANISTEARENLLSLGFTLLDFPFSSNSMRGRGGSSQFNVEDRFIPALAYIEKNISKHRYAVWCDVRDVIFQTNPSKWLEKNLAPQKLLGASECWRIRNDPYCNESWIKRTCPQDYTWLREEETLCGGTLAGEVTAVHDVLRRVYEMTKANPEANDQAALNYILRTSPMKEITRIPKMRENFTATCSAFSTDGFSSHCSQPDVLTDTSPVFDKHHAVVLAPETNKPFCIVHQYDRDPAWNTLIENDYKRVAPERKTAIILISTGDAYNKKFLFPLIASIKKFMPPNTVIVFTDSTQDLGLGVIKIPHVSLGGRDEAFKRYHIFLSERERLAQFDFILYMDADCLVVDPIGDEIFSDGFTAVLHPWDGRGGVENFKFGSLEPNPKSTAYVDRTKVTAYYQGCLQGAPTEKFLAMAECLSKRIDEDTRNGLTARTLDESHLNRYLFDNPPTKVLFTAYCYMSGAVNGTPKIRHFNANGWQK